MQGCLSSNKGPTAERHLIKRISPMSVEVRKPVVQGQGHGYHDPTFLRLQVFR